MTRKRPPAPPSANLRPLSSAPAPGSSPAPGSQTGLAPADAPGAAPASGSLVRLAVGRALADPAVDIDDQNAVLRNVPFMSIGPALGHGFDIDAVTLQTQLAALNANADSLRCRISHPELNQLQTRDGAECLVGWPLNWRIEGDQIRGDIQISPESIVPNHRKFLLSIARHRPTALGLSVVSAFDYEAGTDPATGQALPPVARALYCKAVDFVDDPAANRNGLLTTPPPTPFPGNPPMNRRLRRYLESQGLAAGATPAVALAFLATLDDKPRQIAQALKEAKDSDTALAAPIADKLRALGVDPEDPAQALASAGSTTGGGDSNTDPATPLSANPAALAASGASGASGGAGSPSLSRDDVSQMVQRQLVAGFDAESQRQAQITTLSTELNLGDNFARRHITARSPFATVQLLASEIGHRQLAPVRGLSVAVGDDGRKSAYAAMQDAIALRCGVELYEETPAVGRADSSRPVSLRRGTDGQPVARAPHQRTGEFEHLSLVEVTRRYLASLGVPGVDSMTGLQCAQLATDRLQLAGVLGGVALSHTTSDFPGIFASVLNKLLLPGYDQAPSTHREFTAEREVNDFKDVQFNQLGHTSRLRQVLEGAEYTYGTLSEKTASARVHKFGLLIAITWEMIVSDDLDAFSSRALGFAETAQLLEDDEFYGYFLTNPVLEENGKALFHADHNNLNLGGAAAFGRDPLRAMRKAMATQRGIAPSKHEPGRTLNLVANKILCPWELEPEISQLVASLVDPSKNNAAPNDKFIRNFRVVPEARLDADSATAYYTVAAGRRSAPAAYVLRLRGYKTPTIEQISVGSSVDGMTYECRHVFGKKITDFRNWQKNDGA